MIEIKFHESVDNLGFDKSYIELHVDGVIYPMTIGFALELSQQINTAVARRTTSDNSDKTICCNNCKNISTCKLAWQGSDWDLSTDYCSKHIV